MGSPGASALLEAHFTPVQSSSLCTGYKIQKRWWLLKRRGTSCSQQEIPSFQGYLAIQLWLMGLEDTFKCEAALLWYCSALRKVSLPCQDKPSEHSTEQIAGWLNSFADHPTASRKTRSMWLQSPVRVAWKVCTWLFSSMFNISQCLCHCQPVRLPRLCCWVTKSHDSAVMKRGGEPKWQQPLDTVPVLKCDWSKGWSLRIPKRWGHGCKANSELCEGQSMSQLGTKAAVLTRTSSCRSAFGIFHLQES